MWSQMGAVVRDAAGHSWHVATIPSPSAQHKLQSTTLCQRPERVTGSGGVSPCCGSVFSSPAVGEL